MICKNNRPQNQYSKDQSRRKESKKTPKGPGQEIMLDTPGQEGVEGDVPSPTERRDIFSVG